MRIKNSKIKVFERNISKCPDFRSQQEQPLGIILIDFREEECMYEITDRHHWDFATDCCYWPPYCKFGFDLLGIYQKPKKGCPVIGRDPAMSGSIYTLFLPYMYGYKTYQIPIGIYTCPVFFIIEFMDTYINPDNDSHKIERTKMSYREVLI